MNEPLSFSYKKHILLFLLFALSTPAVDSKDPNQLTQNQILPIMRQAKPFTFLALGDSYTIGESVNEKERWPNQMVERLKKNNINFAQPEIIAQTGWTTAELTSAIKNSGIGSKFDFVSLLIGVNNQYRGGSSETYRKEFRQLLNTAIDFANGNASRVMVVSIPDYGVTPFAKGMNPPKIAREIDLFNAINREESGDMNVNYIEITTDSRKVANDSRLVAHDNLHPSGEMYKDWAEKAAKLVEAMLRQ